MGPSMKLIKAGIAIFVVVASSVASSAGEVGFASNGEHFASRNCSWCHGPSLQGFSTAPRLAGQKREYLED